MAAVRYIVSNVEESVAFYRERLGFAVDMKAPGFAALMLGDLRLFLNEPGAGSAGKAGGNPQPGGWSRFQIVTDDLDSLTRRLGDEGATFRGDVAEGPGGRQYCWKIPPGTSSSCSNRPPGAASVETRCAVNAGFSSSTMRLRGGHPTTCRRVPARSGR